MGTPRGIVTDAGGNIYVASSSSYGVVVTDNILKYDSTGKYLSTIVGNNKLNNLRTPNSITIDKSGNIYVVFVKEY